MKMLRGEILSRDLFTSPLWLLNGDMLNINFTTTIPLTIPSIQIPIDRCRVIIGWYLFQIDKVLYVGIEDARTGLPIHYQQDEELYRLPGMREPDVPTRWEEW